MPDDMTYENGLDILERAGLHLFLTGDWADAVNRAIFAKAWHEVNAALRDGLTYHPDAGSAL